MLECFPDWIKTILFPVRFSLQMKTGRLLTTKGIIDNQTPDEKLMEEFGQNGDMRAFEVLLARYRSQVYGFIVKSIPDRDSADDLYQEVFLRVIRASGQYQRSATFRTWLFTIIRNILTDHYRRVKVRSCVNSMSSDANISETNRPEDQFEDSQQDPFRETAQKEIREAIESAVRCLPEEQKQIFLLREEAGLDFEAAARTAGCSVNTAKSRMRYALLKLRENLIRAGVQKAEVL